MAGSLWLTSRGLGLGLRKKWLVAQASYLWMYLSRRMEGKRGADQSASVTRDHAENSTWGFLMIC
jgi:hypothetical protein